ncbi:MAG: TIGR00282 family metallophosphoesterase [Candidatus Omnitrophica bacterium]|nr:TIGR00282 family metallophosphoesterase [Candidatus Omnitrophota bacterium]
MKILMLGDVVGKPGRDVIQKWVPRLREEEALDLVVANAENVAGGRGLTPETAHDLMKSGVDVLTNGDHAWDKEEILPVMRSNHRVLRPANYPDGCPGSGTAVIGTRGGGEAAVINLCGRVFMAPHFLCPFRTVDRELKALPSRIKVIVVDIHAEATSEKIALGWYLDGRVSAIVGSHTHVQTADEKILPKGTAYLTDAGMTGPYHSVLGREIRPVLERFLTQMPRRLNVAQEDARLMGALIEVDAQNGSAVSIRRVEKALES